jgi:uncharacterized protein
VSKVYLFDYKSANLKSLLNATSRSPVFVILRCIFFWSLFEVLLFALAPVAPMFHGMWSRFVYGTLGAFSALFITWLFLRYEKRSFKAIGLVWDSGTGVRFFKGLLIGSGIFGAILLALLSLTPLQLQLNTKPFGSSALVGYLALLPLSLMEEIAFRSYPFIKLHNRFGLRITQVIVAIGFALYHVAGGQSVWSSFLGPGIYAFVFGLAAVWSEGIAMPFGIHLALNVLQPLVGMKGGVGSVWVLSYKNGIQAGQLAKTDTIGMAMQLVVLSATLLLTEYYLRNRNEKRSEAAKDIYTRKIVS